MSCTKIKRMRQKRTETKPDDLNIHCDHSHAKNENRK